MNSKGLFVVSSPLQVFNAVEAINKFQMDEYLIIVLFSSNQRGNDMIQSAIGQFYLEKYILVDWKFHNYYNYIRQLRVLKKICNSGEYFKYVFIGDYRVYIQILFPMNIGYEQFYLLDDGTVTLTVQEKYLKNSSVPAYLEGGLKNRFTYFIAKFIFRLKTELSHQANLFTMFEIDPHPNQIVIENKFNLIQSKIDTFKKHTQSIYFLGSNMYLNNVITYSKYAEALLKIKNYFSGKEIDYMPHRGETDKYLAKIKKDFSFNIVKPESIIELEILKNKIYPMTIISFFSTGLFTLKKMLPESEIISFKINSENFLESNRKRIENYYAYYGKYLKIVDI